MYYNEIHREQPELKTVKLMPVLPTNFGINI